MGVNRPQRVLVTPRHVATIVPERQAELTAAGVELIFPPMPRPSLTEGELLAALSGCVAAIAMPDAYTARVLAACAPPLRLIARSGVGYDSIDLPAATDRGVWVTTTVGSNHDAVADFTLGLILCLVRRLVETAVQTRAGGWQRMQGRDLRGKTLGVVGTGRVGREVATRAQAFGMTIVAYDLYPDTAWAAAHGVRYVDLPALLAECDVVTLHAPATAQTRHLLNRQTLAQCKTGCYVVNTARGELVDEAALYEALENGHVAGAALDVFAEEPPANRRLVEHPRVLPFSHSAGGTVEAHTRSAHLAIDEVLRVLRGERPRFPVNEVMPAPNPAIL
ncbi:MAG: phosphoglycerate dehydrogenase [Chloroflexota bacterium]